MIRVTVDANIYISAFVFAGQPRNFLLAAEAGLFELAISPSLIAEVQRVLLTKFGWQSTAVAASLSQLSGCTTLHHPTQVLDAVPDDPDDNRVLECAVESGSQYIVTGDNDLLSLNSYHGIRIVKVAQFMTLLAAP